MKLFYQSLTKVLLGAGLIVAGVSCSSDELFDPSKVELSNVKQTEAITVGETYVFSNDDTKNLNVVSNTNPNVAEVTATANGLQVRGLNYGTTNVRLATQDGRTITLPLSITGERPKVATELFAAYNVAPDGSSFATSQDPKLSGYFTYNQAKDLTITLDGKTYRTPTKDELHALLPYEEEIVYFGREAKAIAFNQSVTLEGETKIYGESFYSPGHNVAYALRFGKSNASGANASMDNSRLTAFRYEYSINQADPDQGYSLKITARYLGAEFKGDLNTVASEGFWKSFPWDDQTIELPAAGTRTAGGQLSSYGSLGEYWSRSTGNDDLSASALGFGRSSASSTIHADRELSRTVRLILNN